MYAIRSYYDLSVAEKFGVEIIEQETDKDHIHILFASRPSVQVSAFVNSLKSVSARLLAARWSRARRG